MRTVHKPVSSCGISQGSVCTILCKSSKAAAVETLKTIQQLHSTNNFLQGMTDTDSSILFQNKAITIKTIMLVMSLKSISLTIQFSIVPLITGSPLLFAIIASLLCHQMLNSSASSLSPLPSPTLLQATLLIIFLLLTMLLFAYDICYPPCVLHVHTTSKYYFPFSCLIKMEK